LGALRNQVWFRLFGCDAGAAGDGAGRAAAGGSAAAAFFGAAVGPAAGGESFGEFGDVGFGFVDGGELGGERVELGRGLAEEIEIERLAVEEVLDIEEHGRRAGGGEAGGAGLVGFAAVFFESCQEQVVFDGDAAEQRAVGRLVVFEVSGGEDFADFEAAESAADDAHSAGVALAIGGGKAADAAEQTDANEMLA
jgi:hypothetical protein